MRIGHLLASICIGILLMSSTSHAVGVSSDEIRQIRRQFREYCLSPLMDRGDRLFDDAELPKSHAVDAMRFVGSIQADGSWKDVDYVGESHSAWTPFNHLARLLTITAFAFQPDRSADERQRCLAAVHFGLGFWAAHDFHCPNWWYNVIGIPKALGMTAVLMDDQLTPAELKYITTVAMPRATLKGMGGQNLEWVAGNNLLLGLLTGDAVTVEKSAGLIWDELKVAEVEGLQVDHSFHQHGPQMQFGNYGMAYAVEMCRWAVTLRDTPMAVPKSQLPLLRNYLLDGHNWITWNGVMDVSACCRQLFPGSPITKGGVISAVMAFMPAVDPEHADDYRAFVRRNSGSGTNDLIGNRYFWRSDYGVQRGPALCFTLRMHSTRTIGGEVTNQENISGPYLADGGTFVYRTGQEYSDIFPLWNWRQIPGTTAEQSNEPVRWPATPKGLIHPGTEFVGGVSDGTSGCIAMDFQRDGLSARKAWFFAPDQMICLGSSIRCTDDHRVQTTIEHCLPQDAVQLIQHGTPVTQSESVKASPTMAVGDAVQMNGIRYTSLANQLWNVAVESRTGSWKNVFDNPSTPTEPARGKVFTLAIDHGPQPADASYAYAVSSEPLDVSTLKVTNTDTLQAIVDPARCQIVFWKAGSFRAAMGLVTVDQPCVVSMDLKIRRVLVADPTQLLKTIHVQIAGKNFTVELPGGANGWFAGKRFALFFVSTGILLVPA